MIFIQNYVKIISYADSVGKRGLNVMGDINSIFYPSVDLTIMRTTLYYLRAIYVQEMILTRVYSSSCLFDASFSSDPFAVASPCRLHRYLMLLWLWMWLLLFIIL